MPASKFTSDPLPFEIQYRPNRETTEEGKQARKVQQVAMKFVNSKDPSQYRVISMWESEFNKLMNCEPATGYEGNPIDIKEINEKEPCPVGSSQDKERCKILGEGTYTVGGILASGNKSKKNPFVLSFDFPGGKRDKVLAFEMSRAFPTPDGVVRPIVPTKCSYTRGIKIR